MIGVLTLAALGLSASAAYSIAWPIVDLVQGPQVELWAELASIGLGVLLGVSAALIRVRVPGGLAFAIASLLGLQALAVHNAAHFESGIGPQIARAIVGAILVGLVLLGSPSRSRSKAVVRN